MLNLMSVTSGQRLRLHTGATGEVLENVGDGIWLQMRIVDHPSAPESVGNEGLVHCEEIAGLAGESAT